MRVMNQLDDYDVTLTQNPDFEAFIVSDWTNSTLYTEGTPAPEFSGEVASACRLTASL